MFLILDFTQSLRLAVVNNNNYINKELATKKNISEIFIFEIEKFLNKSKINIKKIKSIYVVTGPGSFTGVRSALTFAKSLKLTMQINVFGLSKFEIINFKTQKEKFFKKKCILLHFKDNQYFTQTFSGYKATNEARLVNFDNEEFRCIGQTNYVYDNIALEAIIESGNLNKIKGNFHYVDYNLRGLKEIIVNNMIDKTNPKPLYISNYY